MKSKYFLLVLLLIGAAQVFPQGNPQAKCDYVWPFGHAFTTASPGFDLNFNFSPVTIDTFNSQIITDLESSSICDSNGDLLFYTNGLFVADKNGQKMPHGDSLNYGWWYDQYLPIGGYRVFQGAVILPLPNCDSLFYIFHLKLFDGYDDKTELLYSIVNINANGGLGDVVSKNMKVFIEQPDTLTLGGISSVRHANGRDWWIVVGEQYHQSINRILLNPNGMQTFSKQDIDFSFINRACSSAFSPNGNKFAVLIDSFFVSSTTSLAYHLASIYDFDRTLGLFSNNRKFDFVDTSTWVCGACFSPNSRFLYSTCGPSLFQWDTDASNVSASKLSVAHWDGYKYMNIDPTMFGFSKCGPDGKIYLNAGSATNFLHVIEQPDNFGTSCNVVQRAVILPNQFNSGLPLHPNYRLGNPLGTNDLMNQQTVKIKAIPNPASDNIQFEVGIYDNQKAMKFEIINILGEIIASEYFAPFQGVVRYNSTNIPNGIYLAVLKNDQKIISTVKFIIKH